MKPCEHVASTHRFFFPFYFIPQLSSLITPLYKHPIFHLFFLHHSILSHQVQGSKQGRKAKKNKMADLCVGELTKLRAKIRGKIPFSFISKKREEVEETEESKQQPSSLLSSSPASPNSPAPPRRDHAMSETTVFLIMDRFSPS